MVSPWGSPVHSKPVKQHFCEAAIAMDLDMRMVRWSGRWLEEGEVMTDMQINGGA